MLIKCTKTYQEKKDYRNIFPGGQCHVSKHSKDFYVRDPVQEAYS